MKAPESLHRLWRGEGGLGPIALGVVASPLSALFGTGVRTRNLLYDVGAFRSSPAPLPVLSIGNLVVGGTGKTPVAAWFIRQLLRRGWNPALVTRGYGQDEILLHRRWNPHAPVIPARRRIEGVRQATELDRDIVVVDDGFQHRRLKRDVDVVLLSPAHLLPPRLLPRGPFREPLGALRRAQLILVTSKGSHESESAKALASEVRRIRGVPPVELFPLEPGPWETVDGDPASPPYGPPLAICSVAEPRGFLRTVESQSGEHAEVLAFPDHHPYSEDDAIRISTQAGSRWIATTEKDAVKLVVFRELLPAVRVLPLVPTAGGVLLDRFLGQFGAPGPVEDLD